MTSPPVSEDAIRVSECASDKVAPSGGTSARIGVRTRGRARWSALSRQITLKSAAVGASPMSRVAKTVSPPAASPFESKIKAPVRSL
jgi:hypothetical protein